MNEFGKFPEGKKGTVKVKLFELPPSKKIPKSRYSHSKYMVSEKAAYISTSNWSSDFYNTGGISLVMQEDTPEVGERTGISKLEEVKNIFLRDWNSKYAFDIDEVEEPENKGHKS